MSRVRWSSCGWLVLLLASQTLAAEPERLSLTAADVSWSELAARLSRAGGAPIVVDAKLAGGPPIAVQVEQLTLAEAVEHIATETKAAFAELPDGGYLFYQPEQPRWEPPTARASIRVAHILPSKLAFWLGGRAVVAATKRQPGDETNAPPRIVLDGPEPGRMLPHGITDLVGYDLISALIVRGTTDGMERLRRMVAQMDAAPQEIDVEMIWLPLSPDGVEQLAAAIGPGRTLSLTEASTIHGGARWDDLQPLLADPAAPDLRTFKGRLMPEDQATLSWDANDPLRPVDTFTVEPRSMGEDGVMLRVSMSLVKSVGELRRHGRTGHSMRVIKPGEAVLIASATEAGQPWVLIVRAEAAVADMAD